ncbi:hypothetical protein PR202_gb13724 [Eleusine coracana subsp. coracana]|uniref:Splicing factor U2af large subunit n=1 Tax=Eleusine coracana subsp. coracana TaxID=191504 RepID=A0AAV5EUF5_ELECO|nr:hypothetical protein PR202_gb13724 [Eleusine coracana subsp. coracana]
MSHHRGSRIEGEEGTAVERAEREVVVEDESVDGVRVERVVSEVGEAAVRERGNFLILFFPLRLASSETKQGRRSSSSLFKNFVLPGPKEAHYRMQQRRDEMADDASASAAGGGGDADRVEGVRTEGDKCSRDDGLAKSKDRDRNREKDKDRDHRRDRDRDRGRDRDQDRDRDRDRDHNSRHHRERKEHRDRPDEHDRHRSRDFESKRVSGFDAPPLQPLASLFTAAPTPLANQMPGSSFIPNMLPNIAVGQATRHARRVYVGGLPPNANEQTVAVYFNQVMAAIGGNTSGPGDAVLNVYINHEKKFAFVEMRSVEEASNAMALDGIMFERTPVKVRRPTDYNPSLAAALGPSQPSPNLNLAAVGLTGSAGGLEGPDRIFVGGLPYYFTETQVRELLESFGPLKGFDLVKDRETGNSKGYAFCVYQDVNVTDIACAALNGIKMGDKTLTVRRANQGASQPRPEQENVLLQAQQQVQLQKLVYQVGALPTKVVCLTQVVSADELKDDEEYEDIMEDMRLEAGKYGTLVKVVIPRPDPNGQPVAGVGKVFLEYADLDGAAKAKTVLHGRKFGGNPVVAVCYPEDKFANEEYDA